MRREAAVAALVLLAFALGSPPAAATGACQDGVDNDGDGLVDWYMDPGCSGPDDDSELECSLTSPAECDELAPCPGMTPPAPLTAEWTPSGVLLDWTAPLLGDPTNYIVYRLTLETPLEGPPTQIVVGSDPVPSILDLQVAHNNLVAAKPVKVDARLPERGLSLTVPASYSGPFIEAIATVDAAQTSYLDQTAQENGSYVYWVAGASYGCQGMTSNAAVVSMGITFPPRTEECFYWDPPEPWVGPSAECLDAP